MIVQQSNRAAVQHLKTFLETPKEFVYLFYKALYLCNVSIDITKLHRKFKKISGFCKRAAGNIYKTGKFFIASSAIAFNNVCGHRKGCSSYLADNAEGLFFREAFSDFIDSESKIIGFLPYN